MYLQHFVVVMHTTAFSASAPTFPWSLSPEQHRRLTLALTVTWITDWMVLQQINHTHRLVKRTLSNVVKHYHISFSSTNSISQNPSVRSNNVHSAWWFGAFAPLICYLLIFWPCACFLCKTLPLWFCSYLAAHASCLCLEFLTHFNHTTTHLFLTQPN